MKGHALKSQSQFKKYGFYATDQSQSESMELVLTASHALSGGDADGKTNKSQRETWRIRSADE